MKRSRILGSVAGVMLLTAAGSASAQSVIRQNESHPHFEIEPHGVFDFHRGTGFGAGIRFGIPIVPQGFLSQVNDSFALSVGADFVYWAYGYGYCSGGFCSNGSWMSILGHIDAQWNFYITDKFSVFAEAGFVPEFWFGCQYGCNVFWPWFDAAVGGRVHFRSGNGFPAFTFRLGSTGVNLGVSF